MAKCLNATALFVYGSENGKYEVQEQGQGEEGSCDMLPELVVLINGFPLHRSGVRGIGLYLPCGTCTMWRPKTKNL